MSANTADHNHMVDTMLNSSPRKLKANSAESHAAMKKGGTIIQQRIGPEANNGSPIRALKLAHTGLWGVRVFWPNHIGSITYYF